MADSELPEALPRSPRVSMDLIVPPQPLIVQDHPATNGSSNPLEVVLHDPQSRRMVLWDGDRRAARVQNHHAPTAMPRFCPYCKQTIPVQEFDEEDDVGHYVSPNYFRLLSVQHNAPARQPTQQSSELIMLPALPSIESGAMSVCDPSVRDHALLRFQDESGGMPARPKRNSITDRPQEARAPTQQAAAGNDENNNHVPSESMSAGYFKRFFQQVRRIGTGAYGSVFEVRHMLDGVYLGTYAVKIAPVGDNREWLRKVLREVDNLQCLQHRNVVRYQHSWLEPHQMSPFTPLVPCLFILMQYADGGNLHALLGLDLRAGRRSVLGEEAVVEHLADVCCGLQYLHAMGIVHRDLKPENILVQTLDNPDAPHQPRLNLLITDLGQSRRLSELQGADRRSGCTGTVRFTAPEMLEELCPDGEVGGGAFSVRRRYSHDWTTKADVWSLGAVLFCLAYAALPFEHEEDIQRLAALILSATHVPRPPAPHPKRSPQLLALLDATLDPDPEARPEVSQLLAHPLLRALAAQRSGGQGSMPPDAPPVRVDPGRGQGAVGKAKITKVSSDVELDKLANRGREAGEARLAPRQVLPTITFQGEDAELRGQPRGAGGGRVEREVAWGLARGWGWRWAWVVARRLLVAVEGWGRAARGLIEEMEAGEEGGGEGEGVWGGGALEGEEGGGLPQSTEQSLVLMRPVPPRPA